MNDDELRRLVRDAVARHLQPADPVATAPGQGSGRPAGPPRAWQDHPSHAIYLTVVNAGDACVIEPSVTCDHCGYCRSHGH